MEKLTRCSVCLEQYNNTGARMPLVLSCGHTLCRRCVEDLNDESLASPSIPCPLCRKVTKSFPDSLPANYAFMAVLEEIQQMELRWCSECKKVGDFTCEAQHLTRLWRREQEMQLEGTRQYLEKAAASQLALQTVLSDSRGKISDFVSFLMDEVEVARKDTECALTLMHTVLGATGSMWESAKETIEQTRQRCAHSDAFDQQSSDFARSARSCEVRVVEQQGRSWLGSFDLGDGSGSSAVVSAMVTALQRARLLAPSDRTTESSKDGSSAAPSAAPSSEQESAAGEEGDGEVVSFHESVKINFTNKCPGLLFMYARPHPPVTSMTNLSCKAFLPDVVRVLRSHGPTLEWLSLLDGVQDALEPVLAMPRLKRLVLEGWLHQTEDLTSYRPLRNSLRLNYLSVSGPNFEPAAVVAMLRIAGGAREIALQWPVDSLGILLVKAVRELPSLPISLRLLRPGSCPLEGCKEQCAALREALQGVRVKCECEDFSPFGLRSDSELWNYGLDVPVPEPVPIPVHYPRPDW